MHCCTMNEHKKRRRRHKGAVFSRNSNKNLISEANANLLTLTEGASPVARRQPGRLLLGELVIKRTVQLLTRVQESVH